MNWLATLREIATGPHVLLPAVIVVAGTALELIRPIERIGSRPRLFNIAYHVLIAAIIIPLGVQVSQVSYGVARVLGGGWIDLRFDSGAGILLSLAAALINIAVFDFFYYWLHRAQHRIPALWEEHKLHHSEEAVNITTSFRTHWLEVVLFGPAILFPMGLLFELPGLAVETISWLIMFHRFAVHLNLRLDLGPLTPIIAGPQWHRLHHSRLPQHLDRNFAVHFPLWDILFGSYVKPGRGEYPPTGLAHGERVDSLARAFLLPFIGWWRMLTRIAA